MPRKSLIVVSAALVFTGCSKSGEAATGGPESTDQVSVASASESTESIESTGSPTTSPNVDNETGNSTETDSTTPTTAASAGSVTAAQEAPALEEVGPSAAVQGGALPTEVVTAFTDGGGDLTSTQAWQQRFGLAGLPWVEGPDVQLSGVTLDATRLDDGTWQRVDEAAWLFMDRDQTATSVLDQLAAQAGLGSDYSERATNEQGADCIERTYEADATWTLSGCDYQVYSGMHAAVVRRRGVFSTGPQAVAESQPEMLRVTGGQVESSKVSFDAPTGGTTLSVSVEISFSGGLETVTAGIDDSYLADWARIGGDNSFVMTGPSGDEWMVGDGIARYSSRGRL